MKKLTALLCVAAMLVSSVSAFAAGSSTETTKIPGTDIVLDGVVFGAEAGYDSSIDHAAAPENRTASVSNTSSGQASSGQSSSNAAAPAQSAPASSGQSGNAAAPAAENQDNANVGTLGSTEGLGDDAKAIIDSTRDASNPVDTNALLEKAGLTGVQKLYGTDEEIDLGQVKFAAVSDWMATKAAGEQSFKLPDSAASYPATDLVVLLIHPQTGKGVLLKVDVKDNKATVNFPFAGPFILLAKAAA
jgi:hypothetical protein